MTSGWPQSGHGAVGGRKTGQSKIRFIIAVVDIVEGGFADGEAGRLPGDAITAEGFFQRFFDVAFVEFGLGRFASDNAAHRELVAVVVDKIVIAVRTAGAAESLRALRDCCRAERTAFAVGRDIDVDSRAEEVRTLSVEKVDRFDAVRHGLTALVIRNDFRDAVIPEIDAGVAKRTAEEIRASREIALQHASRHGFDFLLELCSESLEEAADDGNFECAHICFSSSNCGLYI